MTESTKNLFALMIGGFIGAVLRFEIGEWLPNSLDGFPWSTLLINWSGCLFLGWFLTITLQFVRLRPEIRLGLSSGVTGSFTTFSAFSVQSVHLFMIGHSAAAFLYLLLSGAGGLLWCILGVAFARFQVGKRLGGFR